MFEKGYNRAMMEFNTCLCGGYSEVIVSPNQYNKSHDNLPKLRNKVVKETVVQIAIISPHLMLLHY